ncbi:hypothetical protein DH2020_044999 [Rehmannia glutinosa]|uniref:UPF3 domain-containing protein n=1 Tax=Rehmannia glutinosa TaxID=99300 RepID=A0ABR0UGD8_REHGL
MGKTIVVLDSHFQGPLDRTKVVLRHLPPTISQSNLVEHVDSRFSGRYHWLAFRPGKSSPKHLTHSRAYINFNRPEDVIEFAEFFNGHVFVNEKGAQFKAIVEYAPSQRVPKQWSKKDGREGTILKDPEYLEFLEIIAKPVENLPSAEIQLERKEAERAGAPKDAPIVTPLMEFVRQKRVAKGGARYVLRDSSKGVGGKDKSTYLLVPKHDDQQLTDKSATLASVTGTDALEGENGGSGPTGVVKKKILLLKGKEKEISNVSGGSSLHQNATNPAKNSHSSAPFRQNQRRETNGRIIRSILLNRDTRQNQPPLGSQSELRIQTSNQDRDKKPPRPPSMQSFQKETNGVLEDKVVSNDLHAVHTGKQDRRTKNKDRPDRGVWTPLRRSEGSHASDDSLSSSASQTSQVDSAEGSYRNGGRRGSAYNIKDADGSSAVEGKPLKRGGGSGYGSHEASQGWIQSEKESLSTPWFPS